VHGLNALTSSSIAMTFAKTTAGGVARLRFPPGKTP